MKKHLASLGMVCALGVSSLAAQGASTSDLVYTTLPEPCRIINTRLAGGTLFTARSFKVAGTSGFDTQGGTAGGCGIPAGPAVSAMINFVAVDPTAIGNLRGSAWPNPVPPVGSIINYQQLNPTLNTANGVIFPICDSTVNTCSTGYDITVQPNVGAIDLVADVFGYYAKAGSAAAVPPTQRDLTYTTLPQPCRIMDTRVAGGPLLGVGMRDFKVVGTTGFDTQGGTAGGCGVPVGATAAMINFVGVDPTGIGNLKGSAYPNPIPATGSVINYQQLTPALNIANGVLFPICDPAVSTCTYDITLQPNQLSGSTVQVVADVIGYFTSTPQPGSSIPITQRDLTYTTFQQPCRIIDTRATGAGGPLVPGTPRGFVVAGTTGFDTQGGTAGGCGVPSGATVALINFVAVDPQGPGNLKGSAFPNPIPVTGSVINYQLLSPNLNLANAVLFPICDPAQTACTSDITLQANASAVQVVADVIGYATSHLPDPSAIYVSMTDAAAANDATCGLGPVGTGTGNHPCLTIGYGLSRAAAESRTRVDVAAGVYAEQVQLASGISLYGGYNASTWQRNPALNTATISNLARAVTGSNVANVVIDGFTITTTDAPLPAGQTAVALTLVNANAVQVSNNTIHAGPGGHGPNGPNGAPPANPNAPNGAPGQNGCSGCSSGGLGGPQTAAVEFGGAGGNGGYDTGDGQGGFFGTGGATTGSPGTSASCFQTGGNNGGPAGGGANGNTGTNGAGGTIVGGGNWTSSGNYVNAPAGNGLPGTNGKGGSGGGGGGGGQADVFCLADRGGGGGAGGAGGLGGSPGLGGGGGGASVAVALFGSPGVTLTNNALSSSGGGAGGNGGTGGTPQVGGNGGPGGSGADNGGGGGSGGPGGTGGQGGSGGGAAGGPSIGIVYNAGSVGFTQTGNSIAVGAGGFGGSCFQGGCQVGMNAGSYPAVQVP